MGKERPVFYMGRGQLGFPGDSSCPGEVIN